VAFDMLLARLVPELIRSLSETFVKEKAAVTLGLDAAVTEPLLRWWVHSTADPARPAIEELLALAQIAPLPPPPAPAPGAPPAAVDPAAPISRATAAGQLDTLVRLKKVAAIVKGFKLTLDEVRFAIERAADPERGWLKLAELPVAQDAHGAERFAQWERLRDYAQLRDSMPSGEPALHEIFEAAIGFDPAGDAAAALTGVLGTVAERGGWDPRDLAALADPARLGLVYPDAFKDERGLVRMKRVLDVLRRLGMSPQQVWSWIGPDVSEEQALSIKQAAKAKYETDEWLEIARPLRDSIRRGQRDALVAFLIANPERVGGPKPRTADDLLERFLIDVQMDPCMLTSRIVQAHGTVQLFVQRCLMNIEPDVDLSVADSLEWGWMKNYRVWEANRKVFTYPENWIEPELRDDKTQFFGELESELIQTEVTKESAEIAYLHYLEKLDSVARLEVVGTYHELEGASDNSVAVDALHVVGRTRAKPHHYFWRTRFDGKVWTAWEKIDVEVDGDHVLPIIYNRRPYLFWFQFVEGGKEEVPSGDHGHAPRRFLDVSLVWTEKRQGKWAPKRVSDIAVRYEVSRSDLSFTTHVDGSNGDLLIRAVTSFAWKDQEIWFGTISLPVYGFTPLNGFRFSAGDGTVGEEPAPINIGPDVVPSGTTPLYQSFAEVGNVPLKLPYSVSWFGGWDENEALSSTPGWFALVGPHANSRFDSRDAFFFQDSARSYYVDPFVPFLLHIPNLLGDGARIPLEGIKDFLPRYLEKLGPVKIWPPPEQDLVARALGHVLPDPEEGFVNPADRFVFDRSSQVLATAAARAVATDAAPVVTPQPLVTRLAAADVGTPAAAELASVEERPADPLGGIRFDRVGRGARATERLFSADAGGPPMMMMRSAMTALNGGGEPAAGVRALGLAHNALEGGALIREAPATLQFETSARDLIVKQAWSGVKIEDVGLGEAIKWPFGRNRPAPHYVFETFYHPWVRMFVRELNRFGVDGLLRREIQKDPLSRIAGAHERFDFAAAYSPTDTVAQPYPGEQVDFAYGGAYSQYNWELFFHAPFMIADRLSKNQRFREAQDWFHYIFDPTDSSSEPVPQRYWRTLPLYENTTLKPIDELMLLLSRDPEDAAAARLKESVEAQVKEWRSNPFKPHAIARLRPSAYQMAIVMRYIDNLVAWGDQLFRQDTMESVNEATQVYLLAADILGQRPETVPPRGTSEVKSFAELKPHLDAFSNAVLEMENELPPLRLDVVGSLARGARRTPAPAAALGPTLYFCVPKNDKLLGYWDTVGDRLFKIRHCMNIEGVVRELSLFAPPIDPGMLVRAAAAGVSLDAALAAGASASLPRYRFQAFARKAAELAADVRALGAELLSALEKRDAEDLALLRQTHERSVLEAEKEVREHAISEAEHALEALNRSRLVMDARREWYATREKISSKEQDQLSDLSTAAVFRALAGSTEALAGFLGLIPTFDLGAEGGFSSPVVKASWGGGNLSSGASGAARVLSTIAGGYESGAQMASVSAGHERRWDEWKNAEDLATKEVAQIDEQILAAELRRDMAKSELRRHELATENAAAVDDYLHTKFTNRELYDWMVGQISGVFFQGYQLAFDTAKRAETAFRYELADDKASFIGFGYWDSLKKGLMAGEKLAHDLKRMELAYLDQNRREYEITKHVSLALTDPVALVKLRSTGECFVELPESLFDRDYPGHYMRRIKSVAISIPAVAGPYTGTHCTLTLMRNSLRAGSTAGSGYARAGTEDPRFRDNLAAIQSIVTSAGHNDSGLFEADLHDERYLPFEGAGAISQWRIELPKETNRFDFDTISDVIVHVRYTAREGGAALKAAALEESVRAEPLTGVKMLSVRTEFAGQWARFVQPGDATPRTLELDLKPELFPFDLQARDMRTRPKQIALTRIEVLLRVRERDDDQDPYPSPLALQVEPPGGAAAAVALDKDPRLEDVPHGRRSFDPPIALADPWTWKLTGPVGPLAGQLEDMIVLCHYTAAS
jgi:hypothetical protein